MINEMKKARQAKQRSVSRSRDTDPRLEDIEKVYRSDAYKAYIRAVPKHRRQSRDPKTPDRRSSVSSTVWNEKVDTWKSDLDNWQRKRGDTPTSRIKDPNAKNDLVRP
jgi:hypothetical protein